MLLVIIVVKQRDLLIDIFQRSILNMNQSNDWPDVSYSKASGFDDVKFKGRPRFAGPEDEV
jgi:hypothetical protein